jgi:inhibitor of cysteine peptidase
MLKLNPLRLAFALALPAAPGLAESLALAPGQAKEFTLPENPTTGYVWRLDTAKSRNEGVVALDDLGFVAPPRPKPGSPPIVGAPGVHKWSVTGLAPGEASLILLLERPWEKNAAPAETREVDARVK